MLYILQQFHFSIIHRPDDDHGNADGLSVAPSSPFDPESTGSSEDADLIPIH